VECEKFHIALDIDVTYTLPNVSARRWAMGVQNFNVNHGLLLGPESAIVVGDARGKESLRTGVYGHSDQVVGVVADSTSGTGLIASGATAAYFYGPVEVAGTLTVEGVPIILRLNQILNVLTDTKNALAGLQQRTYHGAPIGPRTRPGLQVQQDYSADADKGNGPGISVNGSGFLSDFNDFTDTGGYVPAPKGVTVWALISHLYTGVRGVLREQETFVFMPDSSGAFSQKITLPRVMKGDTVTFAATDGSADGFDATGKLWSNNVQLVMF
jgi:hypothetical protein